MKRRGREKKEGLNEVDVFVGQRLRELRMLAGLSQSDVAQSLGLTFQQLQKYERGFNRVSSSRLFRLSQFFRVPVSVFFEGLEDRAAATEATSAAGAVGEGVGAGDGGSAGEGPLDSREALMLARYFQNIRDPQIRSAIRELAERCAQHGRSTFPAVGTDTDETEAETVSAAKRTSRGRGRRSAGQAGLSSR